MAIENEQEVVEFLRNDSNKDFLEKNGFITTKEVEKEITEAGIKAFLEKNKDVGDKFKSGYLKTFLKEKTGVDVEDVNAEKIYLKKDIDVVKKLAVDTLLKDVKYKDLLTSKIDLEKINFENGELKGLNEQIETLKTGYSDLFSKNVQTPPVVKKEVGNTAIQALENEIQKLAKHSSWKNRAKILELNKQLENLKKEGE